MRWRSGSGGAWCARGCCGSGACRATPGAPPVPGTPGTGASGRRAERTLPEAPGFARAGETPMTPRGRPPGDDATSAPDPSPVLRSGAGRAGSGGRRRTVAGSRDRGKCPPPGPHPPGPRRRGPLQRGSVPDTGDAPGAGCRHPAGRGRCSGRARAAPAGPGPVRTTGPAGVRAHAAGRGVKRLVHQGAEAGCRAPCACFAADDASLRCGVPRGQVGRAEGEGAGDEFRRTCS